MTSITREDVMPIEELCEILGLKRDTVIRRAHAGTIPCVNGATRVPIFLRADIAAWLAQHSTRAA